MSQSLVTKNACIYANRSRRWWLTSRVLKRIEGIKNPRDNGFLSILPAKLTFEVEGMTVTLQAQYDVDDGKKFAEHIRGFKGWCSVAHGKKPDFDLEFFQRYLDTVGQSYGIVADREFALDSPLMDVLVRIADALDGFVFVHSSVINGSGIVLFGLLSEIHGDAETT